MVNNEFNHINLALQHKITSMFNIEVNNRS